MATFDTHAVVKDLKAAGFTDEQAEAVTRVVCDAWGVEFAGLATKVDLAEVRAAMEIGLAAAKVDLAAVKADLDKGLAALKVDLAAVKADLDKGLAASKLDLAQAKSDILKWLVGSIGLQTVVILGAVITLDRLIGH